MQAGEELQLPRRPAVGLARTEVLRRMVVRDHDAVRVVEERALEHLARLCEVPSYVN